MLVCFSAPFSARESELHLSEIIAMRDKAGHVKKYCFQGGNVIELLRKLKFEDNPIQIELWKYTEKKDLFKRLYKNY